MIRVRAVQGFQPLRLGLGVLLALMVLMSAWLGAVASLITTRQRASGALARPRPPAGNFRRGGLLPAER
jgi:hypothetical protein